MQTAQGQDVRGAAAAENLEDVALQEGAVAGEKGREQGSGAFMGEGQAGQQVFEGLQPSGGRRNAPSQPVGGRAAQARADHQQSQLQPPAAPPEHPQGQEHRSQAGQTAQEMDAAHCVQLLRQEKPCCQTDGKRECYRFERPRFFHLSLVFC